MDIINIDFEKSLILTMKGKRVTLTAFKTDQHSNIKMGINASRDISINREEIYLQKQEKILAK